jgi:hypothetical protein
VTNAGNRLRRSKAEQLSEWLGIEVSENGLFVLSNVNATLKLVNIPGYRGPGGHVPLSPQDVHRVPRQARPRHRTRSHLQHCHEPWLQEGDDDEGA